MSHSEEGTSTQQPEVKTNSNESNQNNFWSKDFVPRGPGRAVMKHKSMSTVGKPNAKSNHRRNHSTSFESFTASCDDAWDSNVEAAVNSMSHLSMTENKSRTASVTDPMPPTSSKNSLVPRESITNPTPSKVDQTEALTTRPCDPKLAKFKKLLYEDEVTDVNQIRTLSWAGIPSEVRPITWKLLMGYVPMMSSKRNQVLERRRSEYHHLVHQYYNNKSTNDEMWRQIHIDIPRMQPLISIFQQEVVQKIFERILYIWSIRHPASGYVQGMNDLVTPFFVTYLSEFIPGHSLADVESFEVSSLSDSILRGVEADSFWSFSKLLDSIQDNYTFAQPGIQRLVNLLSRVMSRVDVALHDHLMKNSVQYLQFSFRWMNNLLIRELPLRCIIRLWDTYLAEGAVSSNSNSSTSESDDAWNGGHGTPFSSSFHLFVCAAFLRFWSKSLLKEDDFQGLMLLLQNLPTFHWTESEIKLMVADAYQLKCTFTPSHLNS